MSPERLRIDPNKAIAGPPIDTQELTKPQVTSYCTSGTLIDPLPKSYATYRTIRQDPTIALGRALTAAPIMAGAWSVEAAEDAPEDAVALIDEIFVPLREMIMETALFGGIDFGWQGYEKIFKLKFDESGQLRIVLSKLKPLLHDLTEIQVLATTGEFVGFKQTSTDGTEVYLPLNKVLLVPFRVEGTQWHGQSLLEHARVSYNEWVEANAGAARYDKKIAGSHFVVYYPVGTSLYNSAETSNAEIAKAVLQTLESSGSISVPQTVAEFVDQMNQEALQWKIEILEDRGGRQPTFIDRLRYLDVQKIRALLLPERAVLEGEFGTKAEAGVHANLALTNMELIDRHITRHINWHCVDQILELNFGLKMRSQVWLQAAPLEDRSLAYLRQIYQKLLENPSGFLEEYGTIDTVSLKDKLEVPQQEYEALEHEKPEPGMEPGKVAEMSRNILKKLTGS